MLCRVKIVQITPSQTIRRTQNSGAIFEKVLTKRKGRVAAAHLNQQAYKEKYDSSDQTKDRSASVFDREVKEAANFYCSVFPDSRITSLTRLHNTLSGDCDVVSLTLWGYSFMAFSAGPLFKFNPTVSFMVNFYPAQDKDAVARIDTAWAKLSAGGKVLLMAHKKSCQRPYSRSGSQVTSSGNITRMKIATNCSTTKGRAPS